MALVKPICFSVNAFDKSNSNIFYFQSNGGDQVVKNTLNIYNNTTGALVYSHTESTLRQQQTLPPNANGITNGVYYNYTFVTYNSNNQASAESSPIGFWCYTTPTLTLDLVPNAQGIVEVNNSSLTINGVYTQAENELMDIVSIALYDSGNTIMQASGSLYDQSFSYTFNGLTDNTTYKLQASCVTVNGTQVSGVLYTLYVDYLTPTLYTILQIENNCEQGNITVRNNMTLIDGRSNPSPPIYINNEKISLLNSGDYVKWNNGYEVSGDFTLKTKIESIPIEGNLITLNNNDVNGQIVLSCKHINATTAIIELNVYNTVLDSSYYIYSNEFLLNQPISLWLRRIGNLYDLKVENIT